MNSANKPILSSTPYLAICGLRIMMATAMMAMLICGFVLAMSVLECEVSVNHILASCSDAIFLGGLGILAAAVSGHAAIGYFLPVLHYVTALMGGFGRFTIFSMMKSGTMNGKGVIFAAGICCIAASMWCAHLRNTV